MEEEKIVILGAGIAGLSAGWLLHNLNIDFVILEKQSYIGGLARSFEWHGFYCDFAAHRLFTSDESILQELLNLVPMGRHIRRSNIYLKGRWLHDPLDILELIQRLPLSDSIRILTSFIFRNQHIPDTNFENYVRCRYGDFLYNLFFQPYTEKLFGVPGDQISVFWAQQKVRLANPFDNLRENTKNKFQYFYYPVRHGYGAISDSLYNKIEKNVLLQSEITSITSDAENIIEIGYRKENQNISIKPVEVISTLPMSLLAQMLGKRIPLKFQKVDAVYLLINKPRVSDFHWLYFIDKDLSINRLVEFKNMSPVDSPTESTILCAEVTQTHDRVVERVIQDLVKLHIIQESDILDSKVIREDNAYPIYNLEYDKTIEIAQNFFAGFQNLHLLGRAAQFKHHEADDNFEEAKLIVEGIQKKFGIPIFTEERKDTLKQRLIPNPKVIAVILTYNHYEDTYECVSSLISSDYPNLEIVVVDNGSSDGTPQKVRSDFPTVVVHQNNQNLGVPAGYNVGFKYAIKNHASYILMLNNDTVLASDMIAMLVEAAESDPHAGILMPLVLKYGKKDEIWSSGGVYRKFPPSIILTSKRKMRSDSIRLIEYAPSCGLLIHRRAFEKVGLFDPGYFYWYDDWDFSERVRVHGLHIWNVPKAKLWHKVSKTISGPASEQFWQTFGMSIIRFYRRHGKPIWFSLPLHVGYIILREFFWKGNVKYLPYFMEGIREGFQKPLSSFPSVSEKDNFYE